MINYNLAGDGLIHCLRISGAKLLLVDQDEKCRERVMNEAERIRGQLQMDIVEMSDDQKKAIIARDCPRPSDDYRRDVKGHFPAALLYTRYVQLGNHEDTFFNHWITLSGTTGLPKGCSYDMSRAFQGCALPPFAQVTDRVYHCMPCYHGTGGMIAFANLITGAPIAIGKRFSVANFWNEVRDSESTWILYVGETARYLLAASPHPLDKQHKVRSMIGNGMRPDVWERFRERFGITKIVEFFNSTEGIFTTINYCEGDYLKDAVGHHGLLLRLIFRNTSVPVEFDEETQSLVRDPITGFVKRKPYEEGGEILVKIENEAMFQGYWNSREATSKKFERDVFKKGDLYYRTGDALRRTNDGRWLFLDRLGDTFRWKGENVSTAEVAHVMGKFPGILEANVYGVLVPGTDGRAGCAAISIAPEQLDTFDWVSLAKYLRSELPSYAVPIFVRVVEKEIGTMGSHNNKQLKGPLREEGIDPSMKGSKVEGGNKDRLLWIATKGQAYTEFRDEDWSNLKIGRARL